LYYLIFLYWDETYKEPIRKRKSPSAKAKGLECIGSPDRTSFATFV
jgi:hypothetical protein